MLHLSGDRFKLGVSKPVILAAFLLVTATTDPESRALEKYRYDVEECGRAQRFASGRGYSSNAGNGGSILADADRAYAGCVKAAERRLKSRLESLAREQAAKAAQAPAE